MSDIVITKTAGNCGDTIPNCTTLTIRNFQSIDWELDTPISSFALPECDADNAILVKAEGNTLTLSISWTILEETCNVSSECTPSTKTVQEQIAYWINCFQPDSIEDRYSITVDGITKPGSVKKIHFSKDSSAPVTYNARIEFAVGNVVVGES